MILFDKEEHGCIQETITLKQISLFEDKMRIKIPEHMAAMPEEERISFYPYRDRPQEIWRDQKKNEQMTFQELPVSLPQEQIYPAAIAAAHMMKQYNPRMKTGHVHIFDENGTVAWFVMELEREKRLHLKYVTVLYGKYMLGTATYSAEEQDKWSVLIKYIFASMEEKKK